MRAQKKGRGTIFGLLFPTMVGCVKAAELTRARRWDPNVPSRLLGAWPKRSWLKRLRTRGHDVLGSLGRHLAAMREATRSRWPGTGGLEDAGWRTSGATLELGGTGWSGQHTRVVDGRDGVLLRVVLGDGTWIVPVDWAVRRPNPTGSGRRWRPTLGWAQGMRDATPAAWRRRGLDLPAPLVVAERWVRDAPWMAPGADTPHGPFWVHGTAPSTDDLTTGRKIKGADGVDDDHAWPWRQSLTAPDGRSARLRATSPTSGAVALSSVDQPGEKRCALRCCATPLQATRLRRLWSRRPWMAHVFRTLKPLVATDAYPGPRAHADDGHLVVRLMACFALCSTSRVHCKGPGTMEERVFNGTHQLSLSI